MKVTLIKAEVEETPLAIMARYFNRLNKDIQDVVKMHRYNTLKDLIHQTTKLEQQFKRKSSYKKLYISFMER